MKDQCPFGPEVLDVEASHVVVWIARRRYPNVEGLRRLREARPKGLGKYRVIRARIAAVPLPYLTTNICQRLAGPYRAKNRSLGKSDRNVDHWRLRRMDVVISRRDARAREHQGHHDTGA